MIPGIQEFHDGMHHHLIHEMEQALHDTAQPAGSHPESHPGGELASHDGAPAHAPGEHVPDVASHHGHHDDAAPAHDTHAPHHSAGMSILHWMGEAALELTLELASDVISSNLLAGSAGPSHHAGNPLAVGVPEGDGFTHQTTGFTCAVVSQKMILDQFHLTDPQTGEPISEARLVYDATVNGWLSDHGTNLDDLNKLLDHYGVSSHEGHDWKHLVHDLAAGHQVVMAVNADELWGEHGPLSELKHLFGNSPNHALVLKGLKVDHGRVVVVVNDPGQTDGAGVEYPLEHFQSAVDNTHMHYVATDHAPAGWTADEAISRLAHQNLGEENHTPLHALSPDSSPTFAGTISHLGGAEKEAFLRNL